MLQKHKECHLKTDNTELLNLATSLRICERQAAMLRILLSILSTDCAIQINLMNRFIAKCREVKTLQSAHCRLLAYIAVPSRVNANFVMLSIGGDWVSVAQLRCQGDSDLSQLASADASFDALLLHILEADHIGHHTKSAVTQIWGPINEPYLKSIEMAEECLNNTLSGGQHRNETLHL
jgi:predicted AlkP superfamily pyrophosphatase or phosphodiesterase